MNAIRAIRIAAVCCGLSLAAVGAGLAQISADGGDLIIDSDTLDVFNERGLTVFEGRVDAMQDDIQIRADRLEVYSDRSGARATEAATDALDMGDIVRVIAIGNVFYVTPEQIASGDRAVYDIAADTVTLTGRVVVQQGCDVVTGSELVMNMTTRDTRMRSGGETGGRVRTVIRPGGETTTQEGCAP